MDVLYACEDVRDHINELCELGTRASGFMDAGWQAEEKVENSDENAAHCPTAYDTLLKKHPTFKATGSPSSAPSTSSSGAACTATSSEPAANPLLVPPSPGGGELDTNH